MNVESQPLNFQMSRKSGDRLDGFPDVPITSLAARQLGKVRVDCRLRMAKSQWGVLNGYSPAGVLYMDLTFDQPQDCRLKHAIILVTLEDINRRGSSRLHLTDHYGPKFLSGEPTVTTTKKTYHLTPELSILGIGAGGLGLERESTINRTSRWTFTGQLRASSGQGQAAPDRTIKWELTENELDSDKTHSGIIYTGFAFEHTKSPFYIRVSIEGKLQKTSERIKGRLRRLRFPPESQQDQGISRTLVNVKEPWKHFISLDRVVEDLPSKMVKQNYLAIPMELPKSKTVSFHEESSATSQRAKPQQTLERQPLGEKTYDSTSQSIMDLASAIETFCGSLDPPIAPVKADTTMDEEQNLATNTTPLTSDEQLQQHGIQEELAQGNLAVVPHASLYPLLLFLKFLEGLVANLIAKITTTTNEQIPGRQIMKALNSSPDKDSTYPSQGSLGFDKASYGIDGEILQTPMMRS